MGAKVKNLIILLIEVGLVALSILALHYSKSSSDDYREALTKECSFTGICVKADENPYRLVEHKYICKTHFTLTKGGNERIIKPRTHNQGAREYVRAVQIMDSLYQHSQFYMMVESTLLFIPVTQSFALFLFICVFLYHFIRQTTDNISKNAVFEVFTFVQGISIYTLSGCVYGAVINELTFGDCLSSEAPEWMFLYVWFPKCLYWFWWLGTIDLIISMFLFFLHGHCGSKGIRTAAICLAPFFMIFAILILYLIYLIGIVIFMILWIYAHDKEMNLWGAYMLIGAIGTHYLYAISQSNKQKENVENLMANFKMLGELKDLDADTITAKITERIQTDLQRHISENIDKINPELRNIIDQGPPPQLYDTISNERKKLIGEP